MHWMPSSLAAAQPGIQRTPKVTFSEVNEENQLDTLASSLASRISPPSFYS